MNPCEHLVLGTAQLGMNYGIANVSGQPSAEVAVGIVSSAWAHGVRFFDTAQEYGASEEVLGRAFTALGLGPEARVVSKLGGATSGLDPAAVLRGIEQGLGRLGISRLWGLMLHREDDLGGKLMQVLFEAKRAGLVAHLGASVYSEARAMQAMDIDGLDLIQVAANVFDRRMERAGVFARAMERSKTVFIRSVYLQGLAVMEPERVPRTIPHAEHAVTEFARFCASLALDRRQFAINHVRRMMPEAMLVIGAENVGQVHENCRLFGAVPLKRDFHARWDSLWPRDDTELIDPRGWPSPSARKKT